MHVCLFAWYVRVHLRSFRFYYAFVDPRCDASTPARQHATAQRPRPAIVRRARLALSKRRCAVA
eukprot:3494509-Pleurochrysis_carterae.AAC.1